MYAILKEGVYTQGVWLAETIKDAEVLRENLMKADSDDYHSWDVVKKVEEGVSIHDWELVSSERKKPSKVLLWMFVNSYVWATDPNLKQFSEKKSEAYNFKDDEEVLGNPYKYKGFNVESGF